MVDPSNLVAWPPESAYRGLSMWVDEQIWGHRLWDSQSPWLLFLEFLNVAEGAYREQKLFDEAGANARLVFKPHRRLYLRNILFNSEVLVTIQERYKDSSTAWSHWLTWMTENSRGIERPDFSYLKSRFHSFDKFAQLVRMIRSSAVESDSNKRWSSRFVFPFGPESLYEDLNISPSGTVGREYINFGRTGELLYLMLCRSSFAAELKPHFEAFFQSKNPWNHLLRIMDPENWTTG